MKITVGVAVFLGAFGVSCFAQAQNNQGLTQSQRDDGRNMAPPSQETYYLTATRRSADRYDVNVQFGLLDNILRDLKTQTGIQYVCHTNWEQAFDLDLKNCTLDQAVEKICRRAGARVEKRDGIYYVTDRPYLNGILFKRMLSADDTAFPDVIAYLSQQTGLAYSIDRDSIFKRVTGKFEGDVEDIVKQICDKAGATYEVRDGTDHLFKSKPLPVFQSASQQPSVIQGGFLWTRYRGQDNQMHYAAQTPPVADPSRSSVGGSLFSPQEPIRPAAEPVVSKGEGNALTPVCNHLTFANNDQLNDIPGKPIQYDFLCYRTRLSEIVDFVNQHSSVHVLLAKGVAPVALSFRLQFALATDLIDTSAELDHLKAKWSKDRQTCVLSNRT